MAILNLTQHLATPEQIEAGVVNLSHGDQVMLKSYLTFNELPDNAAIDTAAGGVLTLAHKFFGQQAEDRTVMLGGAPFFMSRLEECFKGQGFRVVYAFSQRVSEDQAQEDGSVRKVAVFKHMGFVEM